MDGVKTFVSFIANLKPGDIIPSMTGTVESVTVDGIWADVKFSQGGPVNHVWHVYKFHETVAHRLV